MAFGNFWSRVFGKEEAEASKSVAKERLKLVLVHDRLDVTEQVMINLREELIAVIGKYMVIDTAALDVTLTREDEGVALIANIPIMSVRRNPGSEPKDGDNTPTNDKTDAPDEGESAPAKKAPAKKAAAKAADPESTVEAYIEA